ncbi:hypothetical protein ED176_13250 [Enterococcus faecium]|nr:hypothetical protein [Enterococcus faecium]
MNSQITSLPAILDTILATLPMIVLDDIRCQSIAIYQMNYLYKAYTFPLIPKRVIGRVCGVILKYRGCDRSGQLQEIRRNLRKLLLKFL